MATLQVVVANLDDFIDDVMKKIALDVVANLAAAPSEGGTPIDTGWASANWVPEIGAVRRGTAGSRPSNLQAGANNASRSDQDRGTARVAATYKHQQGDIIISNNVPYIVDLNDGSSSMAPRGFVQSGIARAVKGASRGL